MHEKSREWYEAQEPLPGCPHRRAQLIAKGTYTEEVMARAEQICWAMAVRRTELDCFRSLMSIWPSKTRFETWPEFGAVHNNMQSYFAKLAVMAMLEKTA